LASVNDSPKKNTGDTGEQLKQIVNGPCGRRITAEVLADPDQN
jgi:hypothetical protein